MHDGVTYWVESYTWLDLDDENLAVIAENSLGRFYD